MSAWDAYSNRIEISGGTKRNASLVREVRLINNRLKDNLSYQYVTIDNYGQNVAIINSDNLNEKYIYSLPGEHIKHGGLVEWMDQHWLVTEKDANNTVYERGIMIQCNYLLKWVSGDGVIHEQWAIIEDGTKLKRITRNSLVHWKRCAKRTPLTAGSSLEPYYQSGLANSEKRNGYKKCMDWITSSQASKRGRFNDQCGRARRILFPKRGALNQRWHGEDMVCSLLKERGHIVSGNLRINYGKSILFICTYQQDKRKEICRDNIKK